MSDLISNFMSVLLADEDVAAQARNIRDRYRLSQLQQPPKLPPSSSLREHTDKKVA